MVDEKAMTMLEIKAYKENIEFYKKEIHRINSRIMMLEKQVRGRGLKVIKR